MKVLLKYGHLNGHTVGLSDRTLSFTLAVKEFRVNIQYFLQSVSVKSQYLKDSCLSVQVLCKGNFGEVSIYEALKANQEGKKLLEM